MSGGIGCPAQSAKITAINVNGDRDSFLQLRHSSRNRIFTIRFVFALVATASLATGRGSAQVCPRGEINEAKLIARIEEAGEQFKQYLPDDPDNSGPPVDPNIIYRAAAVGGNGLIPALRRISKPEMPSDTIPGAAQVSLARLGDKKSLKELEHELDSRTTLGNPVMKLRRVANKKAVEILLNYYFAHASDPSRYEPVAADLGGDAMTGVVNALLDTVRYPPLDAAGSITGDPKIWATWWEQNKQKPIVLSISSDLDDPYLRCLARKVEWGFPEAILDLGSSGNVQAIPVLTAIAERGDKGSRVSGIDTMRGRAQTGLAKMGNEGEFRAILDELESPFSCVDAAIKMQFIGGRRAVEALMESLNGDKFLSQYPDYKNDGDHAPGLVFDHDEAITKALVNLVVSPPDTTGEPRSRKTWLDWWAMNRTIARFVIQPETTYE